MQIYNTFFYDFYKGVDNLLSQTQKLREVEKLNSDIQMHPCFLFIGKDTNEALLTDTITKMRWAGVISTSDNLNLITRFNLPGRTILDIQSVQEIQPNRQKMPFVSLQKVIEIDPEDNEEDQYNEFREGIKGVLQRLMQTTNHLYVIGYSEDEFEISSFDRNICKNSILFFGLSENKLSKTAVSRKDRFGFRFYEETLDELLPGNSQIDTLNDTFENEDDSLLFYINGKMCAISRYELLSTRNYISLANKFDVEGIVPYGREMQQRYFMKFLESGSDSPPQWYAYAPNTEFAVKRPFEAGLQYITNLALKGEPMPDGKQYDSKKPIVLMGPPSSSKTVALGALAYYIYSQETYPVLFIRGNIQKIVTSENREHLINLMQTINQLDANSKILLICDCSSHQNTFTFAKSLASVLNNIGRRFVLVLSSYEHNENRGNEQDSYNWVDGKYVTAKRNNNAMLEEQNTATDLQSTDSYWIVHSSRYVTEREKKDIQALFNKFGGLEFSSEWWDKFFNSDSDIFEYFFYLTDLVRDPMMTGLACERSLFKNYFEKKLKELYDKKSSSISNNLGGMFPELFEAFGVIPEINAQKTDEYPHHAFDNFQTCIAMFSQYSINVPRTLAISMFNSSIDPSVYYSSDEYECNLERFLTQSIPWICYKEIEGSFFFSFRNTREAILYIDEKFVGETQNDDYLGFILSLLEHYSQHFTCSDPVVVDALTELLREIGPNAQNWNQHRRNNIFISYIKQNLDKIIEKMERIINHNLDCEYKLTLNMITFRREYYYCQFIKNEQETDLSKRKKNYEFVLDGLCKTVMRCDSTLDKLNNQRYHNHNQEAQIINEKVQCNIRSKEILDDYKDFCQKNDLEILSHWKKTQFFSGFEDMFTALETVIYSYPTNGFYYNSLFKLFKKWNRNQNDRLPYYGRLAAIVELRDAHEVINTGANGCDELGQNIAEFYQSIHKGFDMITIDHIQDDNNQDIADFRQKFDASLNNGDPSYIWLICYNELIICNVISEKKRYKLEHWLTKEQRDTCKKVFEFMRLHYSIVKNDFSTLQLMFRVYWLHAVGSEPQVIHNHENECRLTRFNTEQWKQINAIAWDYCRLCDEKKILGQPFMHYIHALSTLHIMFNQEGFKECDRLLKGRNENGFSSYERRMYTPFVLCNEDGEPIVFSGSVKNVKNEKSGTMSVRIPDVGTVDVEVRCTNIGLTRMPEVERGKKSPEIMDNLVLGISYTRFQIYTKEVVMNKETRRQKTDDK